MARISQGNALTTPLQQPGGKVQGDGYGLLTATVVWKADEGATLNSVINRGSTCPLSTNGTLTAHKYAISYDSLGVATITVDYCGIDNAFYSGTRTNPQVGVSQGLTSEHISTHPNFFTATTGIGMMISTFTTSQVAAVFITAILTITPTVQFSGLLQPVSTLIGRARMFGTIWPTTYYMHSSVGAYTKGISPWLMMPDIIYLACCIPILWAISMFGLRKQEK